MMPKLSKEQEKYYKKKWKKYELNWRKSSTSFLIKRYSHLNDDFRKIARDEFKKRKVPAKMLPYKPRKKSTSGGFFG